ncbi:MAG: sulfurtransferase complex subunit TusC [Pseudomonadales bacterium]|nr:sulfurtransferase complex subunit TusC [Pseudomonadales bacterium]MBO6595247.1 sulfurtransferase complex subunit TusC [Pseudomonadales bacterium]MBO6821194.1 sulfurtransferase complex subunit TusC [Pseudomonadales bacterium]
MSSILFIFSGAPHTSLNAQEGLDALLMGSAFTECRLLFLGDGVLQLVPDQSGEAIGRRNFPLGYGALNDYGVSKIACRTFDLDAYNLDPGKLLLDVEALDDSACRIWIEDADKVLNFR